MPTVETHSAAETRHLAQRLARRLEAGARVALEGPLGAGKTVFVQGLAKGLEIADVITSPTFVLIKSYTGRLRLHHCDWYRLNSADDVESSGFDDLEFEPGAIVVEWADKFPGVLMRPYLRVAIQPTGENQRRIAFSVRGRSAALRRALEGLRVDSTQRNN